MPNPHLPFRFRRALGAALLLGTLASAHGFEPSFRYQVVPGDTLTGIGQRLLSQPGLWPQLQNRNHLADPDRLSPGETLQIPLRLLRREPIPAEVIHVRGDARSGDGPLQTGDSLGENQEVRTGDDAFVTLRTPDGSVLRLLPRSAFRLITSRVMALAAARDVRLELKQGRLESDVAKQERNGGRFIIQAPRAIIGIRGTRLRVVAGDQGRTGIELTEGLIGVQPGRSSRATPLRAGQGALLATDRDRPEIQPLLPAPDLAAMPTDHARVKVVLPFAAQPGAVRYRTQIASDAAFAAIVAEAVSERPEAKFATLADGEYWVRVRGIDDRGLEGYDAQRTFRLKARPEPPFTTAPPNGGKAMGSAVRFAWTASDGVASYRFQLARDAGFQERLVDADDVRGEAFQPDLQLEPGAYYWRVAATRADGDRGPLGDPQRFTLKPATQAEPPQLAGNQIAFAWSGEAGQTFEFELAEDDRFARVRVARRLEQPSLTLEQPAPGTYFMRVRATDPDGFVGPFSATQRFEVPRPWWPLLFLLLPLL